MNDILQETNRLNNRTLEKAERDFRQGEELENQIVETILSQNQLIHSSYEIISCKFLNQQNGKQNGKFVKGAIINEGDVEICLLEQKVIEYTERLEIKVSPIGIKYKCKQDSMAWQQQISKQDSLMSSVKNNRKILMCYYGQDKNAYCRIFSVKENQYILDNYAFVPLRNLSTKIVSDKLGTFIKYKDFENWICLTKASKSDMNFLFREIIRK